MPLGDAASRSLPRCLLIVFYLLQVDGVRDTDDVEDLLLMGLADPIGPDLVPDDARLARDPEAVEGRSAAGWIYPRMAPDERLVGVPLVTERRSAADKIELRMAPDDARLAGDPRTTEGRSAAEAQPPHSEKHSSRPPRGGTLEEAQPPPRRHRLSRHRRGEATEEEASMTAQALLPRDSAPLGEVIAQLAPPGWFSILGFHQRSENLCADLRAEGTGCRQGCQCHLHQRCYRKLEGDGTDIGVCSLSIVSLVAAAVLVILLWAAVVIWLRIQLQRTEYKREIRLLEAQQDSQRRAKGITATIQTTDGQGMASAQFRAAAAWESDSD